MSAVLSALLQPNERREEARTQVEFSVFLFTDGLPAVLGTACNFSERGILVVPLPHFAGSPLIGNDLQLGFGVERNGITRRYRMTVRIVHRGPEGIGLAFESTGRDALLAARDAANVNDDLGGAFVKN